MYVHCCISCDLLLSQNRERSLKERKKERKKETCSWMDLRRSVLSKSFPGISLNKHLKKKREKGPIRYMYDAVWG